MLNILASRFNWLDLLQSYLAYSLGHNAALKDVYIHHTIVGDIHSHNKVLKRLDCVCGLLTALRFE